MKSFWLKLKSIGKPQKVKNQKSKKRSGGFFSAVGKYFLIITKSIGIAFITSIFIFSIVLYGTYLSFASEFKSITPNNNITKNVFLDIHGEKFYESFGAAEPAYIKLEKIPKNIIDATLASEDVNFYNHGAIDPKGLLRAAYSNYQTSEGSGIEKIYTLFDESGYSQGGSTITQQLIKNLYLSSERSFNRKLKEIVFAHELERIKTKNEILEMYLNNVYFGEQALGIKNAAKTYYAKDIEDLSLAEISMLVGLPAAPSKLSPVSGDFDAAKERQKYVLSQMYYAGMISIEDAEKAAAEVLYFNPSTVSAFSKYPYFADYVEKIVIEKISQEAYDRGGLVVWTTLDPKIQKIAESEAKEQIKALQYKNVTNAAVIVINNKSGEISAMVGGIDYKKSKVNVVTAKRQPGSSFKPIVYTAGLLNGYTASSLLWDGYVNFGGTPPYIPRNYDGRYRGNVTVRTALQNSLNVPAVEMTKLVGVEKVLSTAESLGINSIDKDRYYGLSIGLGSAELTLIDLATAYSTLANLGERPLLNSIQKINDSNGSIIYSQPHIKKRAIDEKVAFIMTNILSDNDSRRQVFGSRSALYLGERPVAAKTGTTDSFADNWTVGYTPEYTVGVWVGNNNREIMR
ncbi:MAG: PBP1A family penicillin-binding protein, partial [Patescibacteria group bacterium]|nr:PBP1A family penicillin-binding protein [Patescibacteria group bacterium]